MQWSSAMDLPSIVFDPDTENRLAVQRDFARLEELIERCSTSLDNLIEVADLLAEYYSSPDNPCIPLHHALSWLPRACRKLQAASVL